MIELNLEWLLLASDSVAPLQAISNILPVDTSSIQALMERDTNYKPERTCLNTWAKLPSSFRIYEGYGGSSFLPLIDQSVFVNNGFLITTDEPVSVYLRTLAVECRHSCNNDIRYKVWKIFKDWKPVHPSMGITPSLLDRRSVGTSYWRLSLALHELMNESREATSFSVVRRFKHDSSYIFNKTIPKYGIKKIIESRDIGYWNLRDLNIQNLPQAYSNLLNYLSSHPKDLHNLSYIYSQVPLWFPGTYEHGRKRFQLYFVLRSTEHIATHLWSTSEIVEIPQSLPQAYFFASQFNQSFFQKLPKGSLTYRYGEFMIGDIIKGYLYIHQLINSKYPNPFSELPPFSN